MKTLIDVQPNHDVKSKPTNNLYKDEKQACIAILCFSVIASLILVFSHIGSFAKQRSIPFEATDAFAENKRQNYTQILDDLRQEYPLQSIEARLLEYDRRSVWGCSTRQDEQVLSRLNHIEQSSTSMVNAGGLVGKFLRTVHQATVEEFVENEGFGVVRALPLERQYPKRLSNPVFANTGDSLSRYSYKDYSNLSEREALEDFHFDLDTQFRSYSGFVASERTAAGFKTHFAYQVPAFPEDSLVLESVHLVGLLKGDTPVVYVSDRMPDMEEVRAGNVITRAVDSFERNGLDKLQCESDLVIQRQAERIRMLGSIRATLDCLKCHTANRGDLLGAFTYVVSTRIIK